MRAARRKPTTTAHFLQSFLKSITKGRAWYRRLSRSLSVDERTSPVLHKLLWLLIGARPLRMYLKGIAVIEHTWEDQKKSQWKRTLSRFTRNDDERQEKFTEESKFKENREIWHMRKQKPGPIILLRLITIVRRAWGRGYVSPFFTFTRWCSRGGFETIHFEIAFPNTAFSRWVLLVFV